jgi:hypothetical protein
MSKTIVTRRRFYQTPSVRVILRRDAHVEASWPESGRMELSCPDEGLSLQLVRFFAYSGECSCIIGGLVQWRKRRSPCVLRCSTGDGPISLSIPRNFCGYLTLRTQHPIHFSRPLTKRITFLSEAQGVRRYFVGKYHTVQSLLSGQPWHGDEVIADAGRWGITISLAERCAFLQQL